MEQPIGNSLLAQVAALVDLTEAAQQAFLAILTERRLARHEPFVREGQLVNEIAYVQTGMLRHFYQTDRGEVTRWIALPRTFSTSLASFITGHPSTEVIQADEPTHLLVFKRPDWQALCGAHPVFQAFWHSNIEQHYIGMEDRVRSLIALNAEQRYAHMQTFYPRFLTEVPQKHLASMLGIEPRHLSRLRARFRSK